jgi:hypothetical protein
MTMEDGQCPSSFSFHLSPRSRPELSFRCHSWIDAQAARSELVMRGDRAMTVKHFGGAIFGSLLIAGLGLTSAQAIPLSGVSSLKAATPDPVSQVHWHGHGGWGWGPFYGGLAAGAILGAAAAAPYYYGPAYYGPPPAYYYEPPPAYYAPPPPRGPVRQCWVSTDEQRGYGYWRPC